MPNPIRKLRDAIDLHNKPYGVRDWQDQQYRQQGIRNLLNAGGDMLDLKAQNPYRQELLRLAGQAAAQVRAAQREVATQNRTRLIAAQLATAKQDSEIIKAMREVVMKKRRPWETLPDHLSGILQPARLPASPLQGQSVYAYLKSIKSKKRFALDAAATATGKIQAAIDGQVAYDTGIATTNFEEATLGVAAPYIELIFEKVLEKIDEVCGIHTKEFMASAKATYKLISKVPLLTAFGKILHISISDDTGEILKGVTDPSEGLLKVIDVKLEPMAALSGGSLHIASVATGWVPFLKLVQPLTQLVTLCCQHHKIDRMHALHQRLPVGSPCRDAAFEIVDKWEMAIVKQVGGGNQVFSFINAAREFYNAAKKPIGAKAATPAELLWCAAQDDPYVDIQDRNSAFLVLATLFGGGDADKGVDDALAAILMPTLASGTKRIDRHIG